MTQPNLTVLYCNLTWQDSVPLSDEDHPETNCCRPGEEETFLLGGFSGGYKTEIDNKVKKVLRHKYRLGLNKHSYLSSSNVHGDLNNGAARKLKRDLYEAAITAVRNDNNVLPLPQIDNQEIATIRRHSWSCKFDAAMLMNEIH